MVSSGRTTSLMNGSIPVSLEKKLALPLSRYLQQSLPDQQFDVLLTLTREPGSRDIKRLKQAGLIISEFHQNQPTQLLPGVITRASLEEHLLGCELVEFVEGIVHRNTL